MAQARRQSLHPVNFNTSEYSSLSAAVPGASLPGRPNYRRNPVPIVSLNPSPGRALNAPRRMAITFRGMQPTYGTERGFPFSEIKMGHMHNMIDAMAPAFPGLQQLHVDLHVYWPGYRHMDSVLSCHISTMTDGHPTTRWELAKQVVRHYSACFAKLQLAQYGGSRENGSWKVTKQYFDHDFLLKSFSNTHGSEAIFQAEIEIVSFH
ncbi:hypothetical protein C8Q79DRAFT_409329 [Trametes meyenii]|nr:hypothetical protein C8Q79DRAFT_409329 [Trametes meyenii]